MLQIRWHGHACWEITNDITLVTDPHDGKSIGIPAPTVAGDIILVSHDHYDHNSVKTVEKEGSKIVLDGRKKKISAESFLKKASKLEPNFYIRYRVFRDLRGRGYIVKTAMKFGADFRVYDRGVKPGEDHAKWIVFPVHEASHLTWYEFSAKNRVAHSTRKRLLIGCVDEEGDVTYWEIRWVRP